MAKRRKTFRKKITSDELTAQINPDNIKLMERFLKNFATKRSPNSVVSYRSNLTIFFTYILLECENKFFVDINKRDLMDFFDYCVTELHHSPNRYAQMHSCLSSFSSFIENFYDDEYENFRNLLPKIEKPVKENVRKKTVLQQEDIDNLFKYFEDNDMMQDACLLALATSCGARVSELARFTTNLIDEENVVFDGLFLETTDEIATKGRGTTGKMLRKYILKDMFLPYYHKWLDARKEIIDKTKQDHDYIFVTKDGNPANADRIRDWISEWSDIVGQPCYPHSLRHFNTTLYRRLGLDDDLIVHLTGWSESTGHSMIAIYDDRTIGEKKFKGLDKLKDFVSQK